MSLITPSQLAALRREVFDTGYITLEDAQMLRDCGANSDADSETTEGSLDLDPSYLSLEQMQSLAGSLGKKEQVSSLSDRSR